MSILNNIKQRAVTKSNRIAVTDLIAAAVLQQLTHTTVTSQNTKSMSSEGTSLSSQKINSSFPTLFSAVKPKLEAIGPVKMRKSEELDFEHGAIVAYTGAPTIVSSLACWRISVKLIL